MSPDFSPTLEEQRRFWNWWDRENEEARDLTPGRMYSLAEAKAEVVLGLMARLGLQEATSLAQALRPSDLRREKSS